MYKNNLSILKKMYPKIHKIMNSSKYDDDNYKILETRTGHHTLKIKDMGLEFYINSRYNPLKEAQKFVANNYKKNEDKYIIIGFGLGYHIKEFLSKMNSGKLYVFEFNKKVFYKAMKNEDLSSVLEDDRLELIISDDINEYINSLKNLTKYDEKIEIIFNKQSLKAIPQKYMDMKYLLEEFRMKVKDIDNQDLLYDNFQSNINTLYKPVDVLFDKFKDVPAFLISAGPSLDKNINELKNIEDKGLVLCVGRALKALLNNEIYPDAIIITDPQDIVYEQIKGLDIDIPLIILSTCNKKVPLNYKGKKYIAFQKGFLPAESFANKSEYITVDTGGSVATTALDILIKMKCNPITFVGQDLAFSNDKTHSQEANQKSIRNKNILRKVKDIYGNEVYTSKNLYTYLRWFNNRIQREKIITFIDATEGGAKIDGTKISTLKDTIEKYCNNSYKQKLNLLWSDIDE